MTDEKQHQDGTPETASHDTSSSGDKGIGALLREERERMGLSYRAVAERTRLRPRFLEALEKEEWEGLPPPVFLKGFLRTYARLLSLDEKTVLDLYGRAVPAEEGVLRPPTGKPADGNKSRVLLMLCMLVAVAALVFTWREYGSRVAGPDPEKKEILTSESREAEGKVPDDPAKPPLPEPPPVGPSAPPAVREIPPEVAQILAPVSIPPLEERKALPAAPDTRQAAEHVLRASVTARTWMRVQIDGSETREYMFQPGNRPEWKARQGFYLIIGNAGGIELNLNGRDMGKPGASGQVVRLRLPGDFTPARGEN